MSQLPGKTAKGFLIPTGPAGTNVNDAAVAVLTQVLFRICIA